MCVADKVSIGSDAVYAAEKFRADGIKDGKSCIEQVLQRVAACCSVLQCSAVLCNVLQCVAACCGLEVPRRWY